MHRLQVKFVMLKTRLFYRMFMLGWTNRRVSDLDPLSWRTFWYIQPLTYDPGCYWSVSHVELHIVCITAEMCYVCKWSDPREEYRLKENINQELIWKNQKLSVRELSLISSVLTANTVGKNFVRTSNKQLVGFYWAIISAKHHLKLRI